MKRTLTIQVIGSGNAFGSDGRFNTCILVQSENYNFLLDCGASTIVGLKKMSVDIFSLDAIVLTHLHGDHFGGIPFIELGCRIEGRRKNPLRIFGPPGTKAAVDSLLTIMFPEFNSSSCDIQEYQLGVNDFEKLGLDATPAVHSPKTNPHSLRIHIDDFVLAFSGDTEWYDGLATVAEGADIFFCECSSIKPGRAHMGYESLLANRHKLNPKRIILNHLSKEVSEMQDCIFERAYDGQILKFEKTL